MDKFEKLIKQSVEGYEAPFDPKAWDNVSKELGDSFDQMMKDSTAGYEAPYNPAAWEAVSSQLGPNYSVWKWIGGSAAVLAIVAGTSYFISTSDTSSNEITNHQPNEVVIDNNTLPVSHNNNTVNEDFIAENDNTSSNKVITMDEVTNNDNNPIEYIHYEDENSGVNPVNENSENAITLNDNSNEAGSTVSNAGNNEPISDNGGTNNTVGSQDNALKLRPSAQFDMTVNEICQNDKCTFNPKKVNGSYKYVWDFGDGGVSSATNPTHKFRKAGEYTVTLEIKDPATNKVVDAYSDMIVVNKLPEVEFAWDQSSEAIPTYTFRNETYNSHVVVWTIKGFRQSTHPEFEHTFRKEGDYTVALTAQNEFGCTNTGNKTITVKEDYNLLAPTAFSPNNDGNSDNFIPVALTVLDVDFTMTIFDKSGKRVYVTQNAFEPWNGRFEDGSLAPNQSSYIWRVELTNKNGEKEYYEGQVFAIY